MTATLAPNRAEPRARIALDDVSWETYDRLVDEVAEQHVRITYDNGRMELMSPLPEHERYKKLIGSFIELLAMELDIPIVSLGQTTFRRKDLAKGLEPDECYYIQHERRVRGKDRLDLRRDPPPDLVLEIDITHHEIDRESIYAALGVPELWRFTGERLEFLRLGPDQGYETIARSIVFPMLSPKDIERFLKLLPTTNETTIRKRFVDWVRKASQE